MTSPTGFRGWRNALSIALVVALLAGGAAEARRGGSFGSRGSRTYSAPSYTSTAPGYTGPVQRSMTDPAYGSSGGATTYAPRQQPYSPYSQPYNAYPQRGGLFSGFGGGLMTGVLAGGLIGALTGHGFGGWGGGYGGAGGYGGGASLFGLLIQLAVLGLIAWFIAGWFRRRRAAPAFASLDSGYAGPWGMGAAGAATPAYGGGLAAGPLITPAPTAVPGGDEIGLTQADRDAFERLLEEVQSAFAREDYAALRSHCTPEIVSYLSEELSENATHGRKNDVTNLRLLQSEVSEAWREQDADYATVAMKYESIDLMRDRASGAVLQGDPDKPTTTTELWTFVRKPNVDWKLSAIQETA